jgi:hypothetical protein
MPDSRQRLASDEFGGFDNLPLVFFASSHVIHPAYDTTHDRLLIPPEMRNRRVTPIKTGIRIHRYQRDLPEIYSPFHRKILPNR